MLAAGQAGMISRAQVLGFGWTVARIRTQVRARRWQQVYAGVYATFTGPLPPRSRIWAAVLVAGPGAVVAGRAALWMHGVVDDPGHVVRVLVPHGRAVRAPAGVQVSGARCLARRRHPAVLPATLTLEEAVLDETDRTDDEAEVAGLVLRAVQRRRTTPERLASALEHRPRHRHRRLLRGLFAEAIYGVRSELERRYRRDVERAHGLPRGTRNEPEEVLAGGTVRRVYRDVRYLSWGLVVELDGVSAHPEHLRHHDRRRDNEVSLSGDRTLRLGWIEITSSACAAASQVGRGLRLGGWRGTARRCGPLCQLEPHLLRPERTR